MDDSAKWAMVPVEPTGGQLQAGLTSLSDSGVDAARVGDARRCYAAMLAAAPPPPAGSDGWRERIDAEASAYAAEYVMSTEGSDYEPTDHERHLIEDALHGFIAKHWTQSASDKRPTANGCTIEMISNSLVDQAVCSCGWQSYSYFDGRDLAEEEWLKHRQAALAPTPPVAPRG